MHPAGPPHSRSRGGASGFVAVLLLALALAHIRYLWFVCDDAYITYRYASNLAHGLGPVWNAGERVEGYTNFLWMLVAAVVARSGGRPEAMMPVLSAACALGTIAAIALGLRRRGSAGSYAAALLATSSGFAAWATGGLETAAFTLLVTLGFLATASAWRAEPAPPRTNPGTQPAASSPDVRALLLGAVCLALAALTRPEGLLVTAAMFAFLAWRARRGSLEPGVLGAWALTVFALVAGHVAWRVSYYGRWLPNTAAAKAPGLGSLAAGAAYVLDAFRSQQLWLWLVPIAIAAALGRRSGRSTAGTRSFPEGALIAAVVVPYLAYVCLTGGDFMPLHRFVVPILPLLAVAAGSALDALANGTPSGARRRGMAPAVAGTLFAAAIVVAFAVLDLRASKHEQESWTRGDLESIGLTRLNAEHWGRAGRRLREITLPTDTLATTAAGVIPYETGLYTIDLLGLTAPALSRYRARDTHRAGHSLYLEGEWLAAHPPQILLGHPEVRTTMTGLGLALDLEPRWRDPLLAHYGLIGLGLPGNPQLYVACAVRSDVLARVEQASKRPSAMR